jgi:hypothetical protein
MKRTILAALAVGALGLAVPAVAGPIVVTQPSLERAAQGRQNPLGLQDVHWRGRGWRHHDRGWRRGWRHRHWRHRR